MFAAGSSALGRTGNLVLTRVFEIVHRINQAHDDGLCRSRGEILTGWKTWFCWSTTHASRSSLTDPDFFFLSGSRYAKPLKRTQQQNARFELLLFSAAPTRELLLLTMLPWWQESPWTFVRKVPCKVHTQGPWGCLGLIGVSTTAQQKINDHEVVVAEINFIRNNRCCSETISRPGVAEHQSDEI